MKTAMNVATPPAAAHLYGLVLLSDMVSSDESQHTRQRNYAELILKLGAKLGLSPPDQTSVKASKPKAGKWARLVG